MNRSASADYYAESTMLTLTKIFLIAASVLDVHSSAGLREVNPLYRNPQGQFSMYRAVPIKAGAVAGLLIAERKMPRHKKLWVAFNLGFGSVSAATAAQNYIQH
jgi:hypothetical protein